MTINRVRVEPNERVDINDFEDLAATPAGEANQIFSGFAEAATGKWILSGFVMSNPSAKQLKVTRGTAILAERRGAEIVYGALVTQGEASRIVDLNSYAALTYGIYVRFEAVSGETAERIFWDPTGTGSEYSEIIATKYTANWNLRVELSSPGNEWLQIGTVAQSTMAITDRRPFFFEGAVNASYASGWSSDGGGVANDRNANRALYGVSDLQKFTAAVRQCLKDIKGRGLREWYSRDIGGMNIGFDAAPVEDTLAIGDANFKILFSSSKPWIFFDDLDYISYNRTFDYCSSYIGGDEKLRWDPDGLRVVNSLNVGLSASSATHNGILIGNLGGTSPAISLEGSSIDPPLVAIIRTADSESTRRRWDFSPVTNGTLHFRGIGQHTDGVSAFEYTWLKATRAGSPNYWEVSSVEMASTTEITLNSPTIGIIGHIIPNVDNARDLGSSSYYFRKQYLKVLDLGILGSQGVSSHLYPTADLSNDIGGSVRRWNNIYGGYLWIYGSGGPGKFYVGDTAASWRRWSVEATDVGLSFWARDDTWANGTEILRLERSSGSASQSVLKGNFVPYIDGVGTIGSTTNPFSAMYARSLVAYTTAAAAISPKIKMFDGQQAANKRWFSILTGSGTTDAVSLAFESDAGAASNIMTFRRNPSTFPVPGEIEVFAKLFTKESTAYLGTISDRWPIAYIEFADTIEIYADKLRARYDSGLTGVAGLVTYSGDYTIGVGAGAGSVKMVGSTSRDSAAWLKIFIQTTPYYIPLWSVITG